MVRLWDHGDGSRAAATSRRIRERSRAWRSCRTMPRLSRPAANGAIRVWKSAAVRMSSRPRGSRFTRWPPTPTAIKSSRARRIRSLRVFDLNDGSLIRSLAGHTDAVRAVAVSADGTRIVSAGNDRTVRIWNAGDGNPVLVLTGLPAAVVSLATSADSKLVAAGMEDGTTRVFDLTASDPAKSERQILDSGVGCRADRFPGIPCRSPYALNRFW